MAGDRYEYYASQKELFRFGIFGDAFLIGGLLHSGYIGIIVAFWDIVNLILKELD